MLHKRQGSILIQSLIYKETYFGNKTTKNTGVMFKLTAADISHECVTKELSSLGERDAERSQTQSSDGMSHCDYNRK